MSIIVENVSFKSEGHELIGRMYKPNKPGRFPAVAICHGYPGDSKNMDLAEELALNSIVTFIFYYRGAWGSEGNFSFRGLEPSTRDAVEFLLSLPSVDQDRVGLVGYSLGAVPVAKRLSVDPRLRTGVFISPAGDLSVLAAGESMEAVVSVFLSMGEGKLKGLSADLFRSEFPWVLESLNPVETIGGARVPILVVAGSRDTMTPPDVCRALYEAAKEPKKWVLIEGADHIYSEHRMPLIRRVLEWLKDRL